MFSIDKPVPGYRYVSFEDTSCRVEWPQQSLHSAQFALPSAWQYAVGMRSDPPSESGDAPDATPQPSPPLATLH